MQRELDQRIIKEHKSQDEDLKEDKVVALITELSECANEIRFFKYWCNKPPSHPNIILEEFIDCIHLILSLGNELDSHIVVNYNYKPSLSYKELTDDFIDIVKSIIEFNEAATVYKNNKSNVFSKDLAESLYIKLLKQVLGFGNKLGFTEKDIEMAYYKKNSINHKRQSEGY